MVCPRDLSDFTDIAFETVSTFPPTKGVRSTNVTRIGCVSFRPKKKKRRKKASVGVVVVVLKLTLSTGHLFQVTNRAGLTSLTLSKPFIVDRSPPSTGFVWNSPSNASVSVLLTARFCQFQTRFGDFTFFPYYAVLDVYCSLSILLCSLSTFS